MTSPPDFPAPGAIESFDAFAGREGERLRRVLVARYGVDVGNDLCADALAKAWERWDEVSAMGNPIGYLYRVAQSASRRYRRWGRTVLLPTEVPEHAHNDASGDIFLSLGRLKAAQRTSVVLVHAHGWTYQEVAEVLGVPVTTIVNHVHRGISKLRADLGDQT